ncbi:MAG: hypothetical protein ACXADY_23125 [Candidatus Hodarchaeales archaeon]
MATCTVCDNVCKQQICSGYLPRPGEENSGCTFNHMGWHCQFIPEMYERVIAEQKRCPKRILTSNKSKDSTSNGSELPPVDPKKYSWTYEANRWIRQSAVKRGFHR